MFALGQDLTSGKAAKRGLTPPIGLQKSTLRVHKLTRNGIHPMASRRASCSCGQLHLAVEGEPSRIWICHCLECQRRTGAVIGNLARFRREQITFNGTATAWKRTGESGNTLTCYFCPTCGSTIYCEHEFFRNCGGGDMRILRTKIIAAEHL